jgi:hypothetical protein
VKLPGRKTRAERAADAGEKRRRLALKQARDAAALHGGGRFDVKARSFWRNPL